jgi:hypothetical protein
VARRIALRFERGGELFADLLPELSPRTTEAFLKLLPLEVTAYHSRWSGREINFPVHSSVPIPRESQTTQMSTGDVIYWTEWDLDPARAAQAIAVYYGAEVSRDHRGRLPVNVFARIPSAQWKTIEEIGLRIWQRGIEKVRVGVVESGT